MASTGARMAEDSVPFIPHGKVQDPEDPESIIDDFAYSNNVASAHIYIRMAFLRKVYGLLSCQLVCTILVAGIMISTDSIREAVQQSPGFMVVAMISSLGLIFALMIKAHDHPVNLYLLAAFTLAESYMVGVVSSMYETSSVIQAFLLTFVVTMALTAFTFQSKRDFSSMGGGLYMGLWVLIGAGFISMIFHNEAYELAIAIGGSVLFSLFIVFDTHMIMKRTSPEEYVFATINLYLDIINLFLHILRALGERRG